MKYYVRNTFEVTDAVREAQSASLYSSKSSLISLVNILAAAVEEQAVVMRATEKVLRSTLDTAQRIE